MIDDRITQAEREHLDRVWSELQGHVRRGKPGRPRRPPRWTAPPERAWYPPGNHPPLRLPRRCRRQAFRVDAPGTARLHRASANRKLSPVELVQFPDQPRPRPIPRAPFVAATYASIEATCPDSCAFKRSGCFADAGFTKMAGQLMDRAAAGRTPLEVIREEARLIRSAWKGRRIPQDGARGGRDLRIHVGGDVDSADGARFLGAAARGWRARGGGAVWTYTHRWREIPRSAWGAGLQVFASIEDPADIERAAARGYPSALVVEAFASRRAQPIAERWKLIPCPAETGKATCSSCRLCLDRDVLAMRAVIGFAIHGIDAAAARSKLVQLRRK